VCVPEIVPLTVLVCEDVAVTVLADVTVDVELAVTVDADEPLEDVLDVRDPVALPVCVVDSVGVAVALRVPLLLGRGTDISTLRTALLCVSTMNRLPSPS